MKKRLIVVTGTWLLLVGIVAHPTIAEKTDSTEVTKAVPTPFPTPGKWQQYWLDRVAEFRAENTTLDKDTRHIVFLGDSLTKGFKVKDYFPDLPVLNRGIVADGVCNYPSEAMPYRGITQRMKESVFDLNPSHVFFLIGTNDVGNRSIPIEYWLGAYKYVVQTTRGKFPDVKFILVTCPPTGEKYKYHVRLNSRILEWNKMIKTYAAEEGFRLIDLHSLLVGKDGLLPPEMTRDGLHFNKLGFDPWAEKVREIFSEDGLLKQDESTQQ